MQALLGRHNFLHIFVFLHVPQAAPLFCICYLSIVFGFTFFQNVIHNQLSIIFIVKKFIDIHVKLVTEKRGKVSFQKELVIAAKTMVSFSHS
jgi:hypothetical protein